MGEFSVKYLASDQDVKDIFVWLIPHWREVTTGRGDPDKILREVYNIVKNGVAMVIEHEGAWVASMGIFKMTPWAGTEEDAIFEEYWFTVRPQFRFKSPAGAMLVREVAALVEASGTAAVITLFNERRFSRKGGIQAIGEKIRVLPVGDILRISPRSQPDERRPHHDDEPEHVERIS